MVSRYFESMPYRLDETTGQIDYDQMEKSAELFRPKLIVAGASAYSRLIDYERIRKIADNVGAYVSTFMCPCQVISWNMPRLFSHFDCIHVCFSVGYGTYFGSSCYWRHSLLFSLFGRCHYDHSQESSGSTRRHDLLPQGTQGCRQEREPNQV